MKSNPFFSFDRRNGAARAQTKTVALIVESLVDPFFSRFAAYLENLAFRAGVRVVYSGTDNEDANARSLIRMYRHYGVDGFIIAPSPGIEDEIRTLTRENFPVVLLDRYYPDFECSFVVTDNFVGTRDAILHLANNSCRNIAFLTIESTQNHLADRLRGYDSVISEYSLRPIIGKLRLANQKNKLVFEEVRSFLQQNSDIDAIFCATPLLTENVLKAAVSLGKSIPNDFALVSFGDSISFDIFNPAITAVVPQIEEICHLAFSVLSDQLSSLFKIRRESVAAKLLVRESSLKVC